MIEMTEREKQLGAIAQYIRQIRESAKDADQGRWHRTHSQIVSSSAKGGVLVALAEGSLMDKGGWHADHTKAAANARYISMAEPYKMLALCDLLEQLEPELKTIYATIRARWDVEHAAKAAAKKTVDKGNP